MNGGQNRRFPRTARAMPEARPKIEREKIRHRRPNDLKFDDGEGPVSRPSHLIEDSDQDSYVGDPLYQDAEEDWTVEGQGSHEAAWGDEPEDDWVLNGDDAGHQDEGVEVFDAGEEDYQGGFAEESGVVWEEETLSAEPFDNSPDELSFGAQGEEQSLGPEVELAGLRDVRPKAPRPAPAPRTRAPARPPQKGQRRPQGRQRPPSWDGSDEQAAQQPSYGEPAFEPGQRQAGPAHADGKRFSRTRATLGVPAGAVGGGLDEELLEQPRSSPPQRRRQAQPAPAPPRASRRAAGRHRKTRGKGLMAVGFLILLATGGWFAYQSDSALSLVDRLSAFIPLPGSSRTAADTSFGNRNVDEAGQVSPEQALSDLEKRIRQQSNGQVSPATDPATIGPDGPPIPQFKPLPGATRSLSSGTSIGAVDNAQLAANQDTASDSEPADGLSIFEQLWRYLSPG